MEFTLVGSQDADPIKGKISNTSPIGKAIMGKTTGDKVIATTPKGKMELEILKIS